MKRSEDRRRAISERFHELGIPFEIFSAVDGYQLSAEEIALSSPGRSTSVRGRELLPTELGCAMSHLRVYEQFLASDREHILVVEDDAEFGIAAKDFLSHLDALPSDWEVVNFVTDAKVKPIGDPVRDIYRVTTMERGCNGAVAYLVNRRGAEKLLAVAYPIGYSADGLLCATSVTGVTMYGVYPPLVTHRNGESTMNRPPKTLGKRVRRAFRRRLMRLASRL